MKEILLLKMTPGYLYRSTTGISVLSIISTESRWSCRWLQKWTNFVFSLENFCPFSVVHLWSLWRHIWSFLSMMRKYNDRNSLFPAARSIQNESIHLNICYWSNVVHVFSSITYEEVIHKAQFVPLLMSFTISFILIPNSETDNTQPWGTPISCYFSSDMIFPILTLNLLSCRKFFFSILQFYLLAQGF